MRGLEARFAGAAFTLVLAATTSVPAAASEVGELQAGQEPLVTATVLTAPEGVELISARRVTGRGHVLVTVREAGASQPRPGVWARGRLELLPALEGAHLEAVDMSERDQVVGASSSAERACELVLFWCPLPFSWSDGELTQLPVPEGARGYAISVNDRGHVAGTVFRPGPELPTPHAVAWQEGELMTPPGLPRSHAVDINDRGQVLLTVDAWKGAIWQPGGQLVDLGGLGGAGHPGPITPVAINEQGHVAGTASLPDGGGVHAFLWRDGQMLDLGIFGSMTQRVLSLNDRDQIVVTGYEDDGSVHVYLWDAGRITDLGPFGTDYPPVVMDSNNHGQVVGFVRHAGSPARSEAILWQRGQAIDLHALVASEESQSMAWDINERGQIVGEANGRAVMWTVRRR